MGHPGSGAGRDGGGGGEPAPSPGPAAGVPAAGTPPAGTSPAGSPPAIRASDRERDAATHRLQDAFAEGRLDDAEFDERMRAALAARTRDELAGLLADLPGTTAPGPGTAVVPAAPAGARPGRLALGIKGPVRRAGRWRVPERYTAVVYKSSGLIDLRAAELTAPVTTITAVAYKSRISILVPPGVRVEAGGFAVTSGEDAADPGPLPPEAPVVHVRGFAYRGTVETRDGPPAG